jgi:phospholipid transport system substrate-binding protein
MTDRRRFLATLLAGAGLVALSGGKAALASIEQEAADFLNDLGQRAIAELTDKGAGDQERVDRFRNLMLEGVDFDLIAQQVLGRHWRNSDDSLRQEFALVLRETLINRFLPLFDKYEGETFHVVSTRTSSQDSSLVAATTNVVAPNGEIVRVEWYMKRFDQGLRIYDFSAEGVRLTVSLQDEYNSVLSQADGDLAVLIGQLKKKLPSTARLTS